jgi:hypothetical protein
MQPLATFCGGIHLQLNMQKYEKLEKIGEGNVASKKYSAEL